MRISEGQTLGALALLMVSLTLYGVLLVSARYPARELPALWGNQEPGTMAVEVAGDPGREGIYFLPEETTVENARQITAMPVIRKGDKSEGGRVSAGSVLAISGRGEVKRGEMDAARRLALGLPININHASEADLVLVPGIGEKTAQRIIQLRKQRGGFRELSELMAIPGIKEKRLMRLRKHLTVELRPN